MRVESSGCYRSKPMPMSGKVPCRSGSRNSAVLWIRIPGLDCRLNSRCSGSLQNLAPCSGDQHQYESGDSTHTVLKVIFHFPHSSLGAQIFKVSRA